jgi:peroxiredoxin
MPDESAAIEVGLPAPNFALESNTGQIIDLSDYKGRKNVILYFMREFT